MPVKSLKPVTVGILLCKSKAVFLFAEYFSTGSSEVYRKCEASRRRNEKIYIFFNLKTIDAMWFLFRTQRLEEE